MLTTAQKFRLGVFVFVSSLLLITLFIVFFSAKILQEYDHYYIRFTDTSVSGLEEGGQVKYLGVRVGTISEMKIDKEDVNSVIVTISLPQGDSLKSDVRAIITPMGITGLMMIELRGGTNEAKYLKPGNFLRTGTSITASITGKAEILGEKLEIVLNNLMELTGPENQDYIKNLIEKSEKSIVLVENFLSKNDEHLHRIAANLDVSIEETRYLFSDLRKSVAKIEEITTSDAFAETFTNLADVSRSLAKIKWDSTVISLDRSINTLDHLLLNVDQMVVDSRIDLAVSIKRLRQISQELKEFSEKINANPGLLLSGANRSKAREDLPELKP